MSASDDRKTRNHLLLPGSTLAILVPMREEGAKRERATDLAVEREWIHPTMHGRRGSKKRIHSLPRYNKTNSPGSVSLPHGLDGGTQSFPRPTTGSLICHAGSQKRVAFPG